VRVLSGKERRALSKAARREKHKMVLSNTPLEDRGNDALQVEGVFKCSNQQSAGFSANSAHLAIVLDPISMSCGSSELLTQARLVLDYGRRYGLLGRNGTGKSSLMRALHTGAGLQFFPSALKPYLVQQQVEAGTLPVFESMFTARDAYYERVKWEKMRYKHECLLASSVPADVQQHVHAIMCAEIKLEAVRRDSNAENHALDILGGLDFTQDMLHVPSNILSGGWQQRLGIAQALFVNPPVLLLDEPTNHLDLEAVLWMEHFLSTSARTVVIVSHDVDFLDAVCTDIINLENKTLNQVTGGYASFHAREEQRRRRNSVLVTGALKREASLSKHACKERRCESHSVRATKEKMTTNKDNQTRCRMKHFSNAQAKMKTGVSYRRKATAEQVFRDHSGQKYNMVEVKERLLQDEMHAKAVAFRFDDESGFDDFTRNDRPLLEMDGCTIQWPGASSPVLKDVSVQVSRLSRIAILGSNGCGKSTLLRALTDDHPDLRAKAVGGFSKNQGLKIGYLAQNCLDTLNSHLPQTCMECIIEKRASTDGNVLSDLNARSILGRVGLSGDLAKQTVGSLSGGERVRLVLATIIVDRPHVLLLDEPTNHLDAESLIALSDALQSFSGGVLCVSHNRSFIKEFAKELWVLESARLSVHHGEDSIDIGGFLKLYADSVARRRTQAHRPLCLRTCSQI